MHDNIHMGTERNLSIHNASSSPARVHGRSCCLETCEEPRSPSHRCHVSPVPPLASWNLRCSIPRQQESPTPREKSATLELSASCFSPGFGCLDDGWTVHRGCRALRDAGSTTPFTPASAPLTGVQWRRTSPWSVDMTPPALRSARIWSCMPHGLWSSSTRCVCTSQRSCEQSGCIDFSPPCILSPKPPSACSPTCAPAHVPHARVKAIRRLSGNPRSHLSITSRYTRLTLASQSHCSSW